MTQEEKQLLMVDLCAKLPYGVKILFGKTGIVLQLANISQDHCFPLNGSHIFINKKYPIQWCKPYLRPMSNMTDDEEMELNQILTELYDFTFKMDELMEDIRMQKSIPFKVYDWLNKHHFDYRGLIKKGLAIEAPEGMYNTQTE